MRKVTSAWDRAVNMHSSGHAHCSIDTHEDSVALLLDVLRPHNGTQTRTNIQQTHKDKDRKRKRQKLSVDLLVNKETDV